MKSAFFLFFAWFHCAAIALGGIPQIINFQVRVTVGTGNFDGTGQFKFALVNGATNVNLWTNDGSNLGNASEPTAGIPLPVAKSLTSVLLGNTAIAGMTSVPESVFTNADVRVRTWFNDGTHGWQQLSTDYRISSVGYAYVAGVAGGLNMPATTGPNEGVITLNSLRFVHGFGIRNFFAGSEAGNFFSTGYDNTGVGFQSLYSNTSGYNNTAFGVSALRANTTGRANDAFGLNALSFNTTGISNSALGTNALNHNTTGFSNAATGTSALFSNTEGIYNTGSGYQTLYSNSLGTYNAAFGAEALYSNSTGSHNIALGNRAGYNLTVGNNNIVIGHQGIAGDSGIIRIGTPGVHSDTYLSGVVHGDGSGLTGITSLSLAPSSITTVQIAPGAVTPDKLSPQSITNTQIAPGSISADRLSQEYAVFEDRRPSGVSPNAGVSGWNKRVFGTTVASSGTSISLASSSSFTLQPGTYLVEAVCPALQAGLHQAAVFESTEPANSTIAVLIGGSAQSKIENASGPHYGTSNVTGYITVSGSAKTYEVRHYLNSNADLGRPTESGLPEVYARVHIRKMQ